MYGRDAKLLDSLQMKTYKQVFHLPSNASPAQIRLEFGLLQQSIARRYHFIKTMHKIRNNDSSVLVKALWETIILDAKSTYSKYLYSSICLIHVGDLWALKLSHHTFCQAMNKAAKNHSLIEDKSLFSRRAHAWMTIQTYVTLQPAIYFQLTYPVRFKKQLIAMRLGDLPYLSEKPSCRYNGPKTCRLCDAAEEDFVHLVCICPEMMNARRLLLKFLFNERGIRTCRTAIMRSLDSTDPRLNCNLLKYLEIHGKAVKETVEGIHKGRL